MAVENSNDSIFTATTFLTGTSFASLFFLMQSNYAHDVFLLTALSVSSMLFLTATIGRLGVASGKYAKATPYANGISWITIAGILLLVLSIVELLYNLNHFSGIIAVMVFVGGFIILTKLRKN
jgi:hypothetical protein